jgi:hypothetical protein
LKLFHWHRSIREGGVWAGSRQFELCRCGAIRKTDWSRTPRRPELAHKGAGDVVWSSGWGTDAQVRDRELERYVD